MLALTLSLTLVLAGPATSGAQAPASFQADVSAAAFPDPQAARAHVAAGASASLSGATPYLSVLIEPRRAAMTSTISFHRVQVRREAGGFDSVWIARERAADFDRVTTRYADSRTCPAVGHALGLAEQLERPAIDLPGIPAGFEEPLRYDNISLDDDRFTLETLADYPVNGASGGLVMSGGGASPVGAWARMAEAALAACWSVGPPL